jgi:hypothetical protein
MIKIRNTKAPEITGTDFASNYEDFINKYPTLNQQTVLGSEGKLTDNLMYWEQDEDYWRELVMFIDIDKKTDNSSFIDYIKNSEYKCSFFHTQSCDGNIIKLCLVLPIMFYTEESFEEFIKFKPNQLAGILDYFNLKLDEYVDKSVLKVRQGRFAYRSKYDPLLYQHEGKYPLAIREHIISTFSEMKPKTTVIKPSIEANPQTLNFDTDIYNFENLFDHNTFPLDKSNHTLAWLFSAMSGIIDNNVLYGALSSLLKERNSTRIEDHLDCFESLCINPVDTKNIINLKALMFVSEIFDSIDWNKNFLLKAPTGTGKSRVAEHLQYLGKKVLVITPRKVLVEQWEKEYHIDSVCYQKGMKIDTDGYDALVFDEQHLLYEFFETQEYKSFLTVWNNFEGLKACLSATPNYEALREMYPHGEYNIYDVEVKDKEKVVQIILETSEERIIEGIVKNCIHQIWGKRNYIIFCDNKKRCNEVGVHGCPTE